MKNSETSKAILSQAETIEWKEKESGGEIVINAASTKTNEEVIEFCSEEGQYYIDVGSDGSKREVCNTPFGIYKEKSKSIFVFSPPFGNVVSCYTAYLAKHLIEK